MSRTGQGQAFAQHQADQIVEDEESLSGEDRAGGLNGDQDLLQREKEEEEEEEEEEELLSDDTPSEDSERDWIENFISEKGHEFFCAVDAEFIQDDFNLTNLNTIVPHYEDALDIILSLDDAEDSSRSPELQESIDSSVEVLYGVIHSRYVWSFSHIVLNVLDIYRNIHLGFMQLLLPLFLTICYNN
jgi:casein kinase II subunit beta